MPLRSGMVQLDGFAETNAHKSVAGLRPDRVGADGMPVVASLFSGGKDTQECLWQALRVEERLTVAIGRVRAADDGNAV